MLFFNIHDKYDLKATKKDSYIWTKQFIFTQNVSQLNTQRNLHENIFNQKLLYGLQHNYGTIWVIELYRDQHI